MAGFTAGTHILNPKSLDVMLFGVSISVSFCHFLKAIRALQVDLTECRIECLFYFGLQSPQKHWLSEEENPVPFAHLLAKSGIYSWFTHCLCHVLSKTCKRSNPTAQRPGKNVQAKQLRNWNNQKFMMNFLYFQHYQENLKAVKKLSSICFWHVAMKIQCLLKRTFHIGIYLYLYFKG